MADLPQTFNFELVSPDKILVSEPAWQVVIPGEEGYFGVRAGHMSLIAAVKPGVVEVFKKEGDAPEKIFIAGGFADVTAKHCALLAEQAVPVSDLNAAAIEQDIANINDELKLATESSEKTLLHKKLQLASIKLEAAKAA
ncbi:MAG: ATP synthase F1 subunit epsilon [Micavibrio aeruginosavorus]|uniref:ATP synthase epsilon chain n=1 Tax=Micavibrio aeruginosavorus TaxID=349221 RepID=A0A2W5PZC2_9BACT|nr:MAG: ATP synthase F1 subunit epsilon [Micavibrio aeruginosavorus]